MAACQNGLLSPKNAFTQSWTKLFIHKNFIPSSKKIEWKTNFNWNCSVNLMLDKYLIVVYCKYFFVNFRILMHEYFLQKPIFHQQRNGICLNSFEIVWKERKENGLTISNVMFLFMRHSRLLKLLLFLW